MCKDNSFISRGTNWEVQLLAGIWQKDKVHKVHPGLRGCLRSWQDIFWQDYLSMKRKQTAVTNIFILYLTFRMLQHTSSEVTVKTVTQKFLKLERGNAN